MVQLANDERGEIVVVEGDASRLGVQEQVFEEFDRDVFGGAVLAPLSTRERGRTRRLSLVVFILFETMSEARLELIELRVMATLMAYGRAVEACEEALHGGDALPVVDAVAVAAEEIEAVHDVDDVVDAAACDVCG